ncbi:hypothetical protein EHQ58_03520 [Leptospira ognonensis]|uniref:Cys-rich protein n=1 Tax=Leptospira ognonensis TaxID=2484945 RepID=A0A4R9KBR9_9LEPT|nr:hypothetical protein [Leptospira ognonensis]TGL62283.1 hypothetical protein EHQ58_03520 [Leptospira ognonensis]
MKTTQIFLLLGITIFMLGNCGGGGMTAPDPKRMSCEKSCSVVAEKAVKKCTDEKKSADVCKTAGTLAESKCVDECMAQ